MSMLAEHKLLSMLVREGAVPASLADGLDGREPRRLIAELSAREEVDGEKLTAALARWLHMPYLPGQSIEVSPDVVSLLSRYQPDVLRVVPLRREAGILHVAIEDPFDVDLRERAERLFGEPVELVLCAPEAIADAIERCGSGHDRLAHVSRSLPLAEHQGEEGAATGSERIDENSAPIVKLFNTILREATSRRASDVHIEAQPDGTYVRCRIDGVLQPMMEPLSAGYHDALVTRIKVMAELDIAERRLPQDGRFSMEVMDGKVDFRVSVLPGVEKEAVVVRVLDSRSMPGGVGGLGLDNIGLPEAVLREFRRAVTEPHGMVLVTGPTGSGKTTTLYAALNELDRTKEKIITIEDPIEYKLPGILQIAVNEKKRLTFASGLRSILRHDPDKIMVGEIRDAETANIAVQSALTGHLVFTTVHANDSLDVVFRMKHMGIDQDSFIHALNCVLAQRLVRRLCANCKQPVADVEDLVLRHGLPEKYAGIEWHTAPGCSHCNGTGYLGRTVVTEFLRMTPELRDMLKERQSRVEIRKAARGSGMSTLRESALQLAALGVTSFEEVMRVTGLD